MAWRHRTYSVAHGKDGWLLRVDDEAWVYTATLEAVEATLAALGHPCCGRGPLGMSGVLDVFWFRVVNLPNRLSRWNRYVVSIPLTEEQAETLEPEFVWQRSWDAVETES